MYIHNQSEHNYKLKRETKILPILPFFYPLLGHSIEDRNVVRFLLNQRGLHTFTLLTLLKSSFLCCRNQLDDSLAVTSAAVPAVVPRGDKDAIMNSIADSYLAHKEHSKHKKYRKTKKQSTKKIRKFLLKGKKSFQLYCNSSGFNFQLRGFQCVG